MHLGRRRILFAALCGAVVPPFGLAQQPARVVRVGFLGSTSPTPDIVRLTTEHLWRGLRDRGWIEGKNLQIEQRWAEGKVERLPGLAGELVKAKVDVIVVGLPDAALAAQRATSTIPIVTVLVTDPIRLGLIKSYARPGGNITGLSYEAGTSVGVKHLDLLKQAVPRLSRVAILWNPGSPTNREWVQDIEMAAAAKSLNLELRPVAAQSADEFEAAFDRMKNEGAQALLILADSMFFFHRTRLAQLALARRLPTSSSLLDFAELGGFLGYYVDIPDSYRRAVPYIDKLLKGSRPEDLPVEQPTKFLLVVNLKTAKALGMAIPTAIRIQAERVIE
jgi:putative ABC transport system substrate-binding protein